MNNISANQLRQMWRDFYEGKGHSFIGSASVVPENDPTVLFTTAGMHPLVPYLLGEKHPAGKRLCNVQKCVRTGDIDEVGDSSHCTFFEMLGNWSLGDYFKKEKIAWSFEFLTSPKYLGIDPKNLAVSVFAGDDDCPRDEESAQCWRECGIADGRIFFLPKKNNWWGPAGQTGPCGPDTEMFIVHDMADCGADCSPACDCGKYLEIGNDVFMQYNKTLDGRFEPLAQRNVDTGMGLERLLCILQRKESVYQTDIFAPIIARIEQLSGKKYDCLGSSAGSNTSCYSGCSDSSCASAGCSDSSGGLQGEEDRRSMRIVADHVRTAVHLIGDINGVVCSNVDRGYVLRRLLRRAIRFSARLGINAGLSEIAEVVIDVYRDVYPELEENRDKILGEINAEQQRFEKTIAAGTKEFEKIAGFVQGGRLSGKACFKLYDTYGFPIEMTEEMCRERGLTTDKEGFDAAFAEHQKKSQAGAEDKFKGGMADDSEATTRLHTATHLLHSALKKILNDESVNQKGSNITAERLRFDFAFSRPMTESEIAEVEDEVNKAIAANIPVVCEEMTESEARAKGAIGLFASKYGEKVKVYSVEGYSVEMCGGPHAAATGELGRFKIVKEQSSSAGVRRIKAVLQ